jgi:hypothetical protein
MTTNNLGVRLSRWLCTATTSSACLTKAVIRLAFFFNKTRCIKWHGKLTIQRMAAIGKQSANEETVGARRKRGQKKRRNKEDPLYAKQDTL